MASEQAGDVMYRTQDSAQGGPSTTSGTAAGGPTAEAVRAQAGEMWTDAKHKARSVLDEQQQSAAAGIDDFAGALRNVANDLESKHKSTAAHLSQRAADGLEKLAGTLRSKDAGSMMRDLESFARQQPAVFLGAAVTLGFLAMRFLKSSSAQESGADSGAYQPGGSRYEPAPAGYQTGTAGYESSGSDYRGGSSSYEPGRASYQPMSAASSTRTVTTEGDTQHGYDFSSR